MDSVLNIQAAWLDLSKTFNTSDYVFLYKLCHCGIKDISNTLFSSYFYIPKQYIEINDYKSPLITLTHGVTQGSILAHVFFSSLY